MKASEQLSELATALAKAQGVMKHAHKSSDNPFFKSTYADLAECIDASRQPMSDNGLSIIQGPSIGETGQVCLTTRILHSSGQWIETDAYATPKDLGPQSVGSAVTYLRRYSLCAMLGLAAEDDDGNAAQQPSKPMGAAKKAERTASLDATSKKNATKPIPPGDQQEHPRDAVSPLIAPRNKLDSQHTFSEFCATFKATMDSLDDQEYINEWRRMATVWLKANIPQLKLDNKAKYELVRVWIRTNLPDLQQHAEALRILDARENVELTTAAA